MHATRAWSAAVHAGTGRGYRAGVPRLLDTDEITAALATLPGVHRGIQGSLTVALRAGTFPDAVRLVTLVAEQAEAMNHHPDVDLRWRTVTFTLSTHSAGGVTDADTELAAGILAAAEQVGAQARPLPERIEIALDCLDADGIRAFWVAGLGYVPHPMAAGGLELHDPAGRGPVLWFQSMDPPRRERSRFHLDVYVPESVVQARVEACLAAGGRLVTEEFAPSWWVLADPEGNELCLCTNHPDAVPA